MAPSTKDRHRVFFTLGVAHIALGMAGMVCSAMLPTDIFECGDMHRVCRDFVDDNEDLCEAAEDAGHVYDSFLCTDKSACPMLEMQDEEDAWVDVTECFCADRLDSCFYSTGSDAGSCVSCDDFEKGVEGQIAGGLFPGCAAGFFMLCLGSFQFKCATDANAGVTEKYAKYFIYIDVLVVLLALVGTIMASGAASSAAVACSTEGSSYLLELMSRGWMEAARANDGISGYCEAGHVAALSTAVSADICMLIVGLATIGYTAKLVTAKGFVDDMAPDTPELTQVQTQAAPAQPEEPIHVEVPAAGPEPELIDVGGERSEGQSLFDEYSLATLSDASTTAGQGGMV